ncbi:uncharacterized protein LOC116415997 [Nasonia vitripennis]|uniref:Uncharacterized protein n=1 Tax=Nasonia vitripennis TaxID=7425 RepID=A0A7M7PX48_NASVI|nr:uncharacterized protein LOC116415997 [Nasonia vitripennis]
MSLTADQSKRVAYIQQKYKSLESQITRVETYVKGANPEATNAKLRFDILSSLHKEYMKYNDELSQLDPDNPSIGSFPDLSDRYFEVGAAVEKLQRSVDPPIPIANSTLNASTIVLAEHQALPKIPQVSLPMFDGNRETWSHFKSKFTTLVHTRTDISDAVKAGQLFSLLTGAALAKVSHYDPCEADYQKAWTSLLSFYDQKRIVANQHLDALLDLPRLQKACDEDLSSLVDNVRQRLNILERLGRAPSEDLVVRIIERCLPPAVSSRWQDRLEPNAFPKLDDLLKFIDNTVFKLQSLHGTFSTAPNSRKRSGQAVPQSHSKNPKQNARSLVTSGVSSTSQASQITCPKCKGEHNLFRCVDFEKLSVSERWKFVNSNKVCRNCLGKHPFPCKSEHRCKKCSKAHHTKLHNDKGSGSQSSKAPEASKTSESSTKEVPNSSNPQS